MYSGLRGSGYTCGVARATGTEGARRMCGTHTHGGDGLGLGFGRLADRAGGDGLAGGPVCWWSDTCSHAHESRARSAGRSGPEGFVHGFVSLTGLVAPALLGWGVCLPACD